jgi:predicted aldo/keto reductase-like oxidoreductase
MDAYNHKLLYGRKEELLNRLSWHWNISKHDAGKCVDCGVCEELCTQHLPIISRLREIASG